MEVGGVKEPGRKREWGWVGGHRGGDPGERQVGFRPLAGGQIGFAGAWVMPDVDWREGGRV